jgi:hypothetical protein
MAAEVRDIPLYKPTGASPASHKKHRSFEKPARVASPQIRTFVAQAEPANTNMPFPQRSRYVFDQ